MSIDEDEELKMRSLDRRRYSKTDTLMRVSRRRFPANILPAETPPASPSVLVSILQHLSTSLRKLKCLFFYPLIVKTMNWV
jgi:murein tripeptide amidase MpaA